MNILFVCTGNICRSPMATGILRELANRARGRKKVRATSAGVDALEDYSPDANTLEIAMEHGIDLATHRAKQLTRVQLEEADLVLCMERMHIQRILGAYPDLAGKVHLLKEYLRPKPPEDAEVEDPYRKPKKQYRKCFAEIRDEIVRIGRLSHWISIREGAAP